MRPDLRFAVSKAIRQDFENGREYYALDNKEIRLPRDVKNEPSRDLLEWHYDELFRR